MNNQSFNRSTMGKRVVALAIAILLMLSLLPATTRILAKESGTDFPVQAGEVSTTSPTALEIVPLSPYDEAWLRGQISAGVTATIYIPDGVIIDVGGQIALPLNSNITLAGGGTIRRVGGTGNSVFIVQNSTLTLDGVTITSSITSRGVLVVAGGTFIMESGYVTNNHSAAIPGAGVRIENGGAFYLRGGAITNNTSTLASGGVSLIDTTSRFIMTGGRIEGNQGTANPGVGASSGAFTMSGGRIVNNTATGTVVAGGVMVGTGVIFTLNGGEINGAYPIIGGAGIAQDRFIWNGGTVGGEQAPEPVRNEAWLRAQIANAGTTPTTITIPDDVTIDIVGQIALPANANITLAGSGTINRTGGASGSNHSVIVVENSTLTLDGVTITSSAQSRGVHVIAGGTFIMESGYITNNSSATIPGPGVRIENGGAFYLHGGEITNNTSTNPSGGTVAMTETTSRFVMTGGLIEGNIGSANPGVNASGGEFIMSGGRIANNTATATSIANGVAVGTGVIFTLNGGEIDGNAPLVSGPGIAQGNFIWNGGTVGGEFPPNNVCDICQQDPCECVHFIPVTDITNVPTTGEAGTALPLGGTVAPADATHQTITWTLGTGSTALGAAITDNAAHATGAGTVVATATILNGTAEGTPFTQDFTINFTAIEIFIPVTDITNVPTTGEAGTALPLGGTVAPADATHQTITWTLGTGSTAPGAAITDGAAHATGAGTVVATATIPHGTAEGTPFTQDFTLTFTAIEVIPEPDCTYCDDEGCPECEPEETTLTVSPSAVTLNNSNLTTTLTVGGTATGTIDIDRGTLPARVTTAVSGSTITLTATRPPHGQDAVEGTFPLTLTRQGESETVTISVHLTPLPTPPQGPPPGWRPPTPPQPTPAPSPTPTPTPVVAEPVITLPCGTEIEVTDEAITLQHPLRTAADGTFTFDATEHTINRVYLPRAAAWQLGVNNYSITLQLPEGTITLDEIAIRSIAQPSEAVYLALVVEALPEHEAHRVAIYVGGDRIEYFHGLVTITLPTDIASPAVQLADTDTIIPSHYDSENNTVTFTTNTPGVFVLSEVVPLPIPPVVIEPPVIEAPTPVMRLVIGQYTVMQNGTPQLSDAAPFLLDGRTMVPARLIAEALGAEVGWYRATNSVILWLNGKVVEIAIDQPLPNNMGTAFIVDGRTFVPVRFVSEMLGAEVRWDRDNMAVYIY